MSEPSCTALCTDGVPVATIDVTGRTMNVFSAELMDTLMDALMDRVDSVPAVPSCAVLPSPGPYGRVMEIVGADNGTAAALAALAARLRTEAWRTSGPRSVLQQLHGLTLEQQVPIATACAAGHGAGNLAFLDVATCLAGATPAWSGGPLTWQRAQNA